VSGAAGRPLALALAGILFAVLATANAGGYRYGVSDQAFYVPAVALAADPTLFPRDRALLAPQMRLWAGDSVLAALGGLAGADLPAVFAMLHAATLATMFVAAVSLARGLGAGWWTAGVFLTIVTLRHQITRTGANSLEGYAHPRMLAFAIGLAALGAVVHGRRRWAVGLTVAAALVHTTTALWFSVVVVIAVAWALPRRTALVLASVCAAGAGAAAFIVHGASGGPLVMDRAWIEAVGDRSYLFSASWPAYAWILNLAYPVVLVAIHRRRQALGVDTPGEGGLIIGLLALVAIFLASVPLASLRIALAVQLQVNRVFWILDAVVALYVAWWLMSDRARRWSPSTRAGVAALLLAVAAGRGYYVVRVAAERPLVQLDLPAGAWTDAMAWLRQQPASWHVLADPQHGWRFGSSVRVAALRDTLLESGKDPALAIYDRDVARRVTERSRALAHFDVMTTDDVRAVGSRYDLDVFVDHTRRSFDLPVLYRNDEFVVYDLR
jgi:hypothetical protein